MVIDVLGSRHIIDCVNRYVFEQRGIFGCPFFMRFNIIYLLVLYIFTFISCVVLCVFLALFMRYLKAKALILRASVLHLQSR